MSLLRFKLLQVFRSSSFQIFKFSDFQVSSQDLESIRIQSKKMERLWRQGNLSCTSTFKKGDPFPCSSAFLFTINLRISKPLKSKQVKISLVTARSPKQRESFSTSKWKKGWSWLLGKPAQKPKTVEKQLPRRQKKNTSSERSLQQLWIELQENLALPEPPVWYQELSGFQEDFLVVSGWLSLGTALVRPFFCGLLFSIRPVFHLPVWHLLFFPEIVCLWN